VGEIWQSPLFFGLPQAEQSKFAPPPAGGMAALHISNIACLEEVCYT
jgi:hypothetical protein